MELWYGNGNGVELGHGVLWSLSSAQCLCQLVGKSTISMAIFNSYVNLPEGIIYYHHPLDDLYDGFLWIFYYPYPQSYPLVMTNSLLLKMPHRNR